MRSSLSVGVPLRGSERRCENRSVGEGSEGRHSHRSALARDVPLRSFVRDVLSNLQVIRFVKPAGEPPKRVNSDRSDEYVISRALSALYGLLALRTPPVPEQDVLDNARYYLRDLFVTAGVQHW